MKVIHRLGLLSTLLIIGSPSALALPGEAFIREGSAFSLIEEDLKADRLSPHEARMQRFYGVFRPDLLAPAYAAAPTDDTPSCATGLLADLRAHWTDLSGSERHLVELASSPIYRQWLQQGGISWEEGDVYAAQDQERSTCLSPSTVFEQGGPYDYTKDSEYFSIRYSLDDDVSHAKVEDLSQWFGEALTVEHEEMGFYLPSGLLNYQMLVMIERLPSDNTGGFTSYAPCGFSGYMAFVVVNSAWFDSNEHLKSVAAHELFHGVQIEYSASEMWANQESPNRWWIEASAVYMETEVHPDLYNSQASQAFRWISAPHRSLQTYDSSGYQYGTYLFPASAREGLGTTLWFNELWDQIYDREGYDLIEEFDSLFANYESSFGEQWGRFLEVAATGEWDFNPYLPGIGELSDMQGGWAENSTTAEHDEHDFPVAESVNSSSGLDRPEYLGANYIYFDGDGLDDDLGLIVRFDGAGEKSGTELEWEVRLVAERNGDVKLTHDLELTPQRDDDGVLDKWTGEVLLNDFGEDFDGVYLIASPTTNFGDGGVSWGYEAELTSSRGDGSFQTSWEAEADDDDDDGTPTGCACESTGPVGGTAGLRLSLLFALGLSMLASGRRRRRASSVFSS
jgi:hypothetical protein